MFGRRRVIPATQPAQDDAQESSRPIRNGIVRLLNGIDLVIYFLVAAAFVLAAGLALLYSLANIIAQFPHTWLPLPLDQTDLKLFAQTILQFVSDLLLVLIIMEVLSTVKSYIEKEGTSIEPFLIIGIISATRGILSIGARLSVTGENVTGTPFYDDMIELAVNAFIIIALGLILRVVSNTSLARSRSSGKTAPAISSPDETNQE
jgi:uncharacterized membrane protein (DUF373 family)